MSVLDRLIPEPQLVEVDRVDLACSPARAWEIVRHGDLGRSRVTRALFAIRTLPERLARREIETPALRIDDLRSTRDKPGFQLLVDDPPHEVAVGAIGKVWRLAIPFQHVDRPDQYAEFTTGGWVKVAWALRVAPLGDHDSRLEMELRVDATDDTAWHKFRRYWRLIGGPSRHIRRTLLASLARQLGTPEQQENRRAMPGDELLSDAGDQVTHGITIAAMPEKIWPWLLQLGCRRAGFYSLDVLDNAGERSARELHPELQQLSVGQVIPATPAGNGGFEVLRIEPNRALVLGGLYDPDANRQLPFDAPRPAHYGQVTWAFVLEPLDATTTRLHVRARASFPRSGRLHAAWIRPVHAVMQTVQLRRLAARAEGRQRRDDWRDVVEGIAGAARIALDFVTPFSRRARSHWGIAPADAARSFPGDELVPAPRWGWTHAAEIDAPASEVWPWVAQLGADRAGFYSYQWLENMVGGGVRNAETLHPEWEVREGDGLLLHPKLPPLPVVRVDNGHYFLAYAAPNAAARAAGEPWVAASWLFLVEPLGEHRCRFISRYRVDTSRDLTTRASLGPSLVEPIGFAMDRRMLLGVKQRAERLHRVTSAAA